MRIKEEHKPLLKNLGLDEGDFSLFDGTWVSYEYDPEKGVRIYDPHYSTSYSEYIGVDGWSAWSSEEDTFMSDILKGVHEKVREREAASPEPAETEIAEGLKKRFSGTSESDPEQ